MRTGLFPDIDRVWKIGLLGLGCLSIFGCAESGSVFTRRSSVGSLKAGMSHLEYENKDLKQKLADLRSINRQVENRLVQEESANGELKARLDNARTLISDRGLAENQDGRSRDTTSEPALSEPRRTIPAGSSSKTRRKPPVAQIGRLHEPIEDESSEPPVELPPAPDLRVPSSDDQSRAGDPNRWLPITRGAMESSKRR